MNRPQVYPGLPRAWRDATSVQWGLPGQRGIVLAGLEPGDDAVLEALDGVHDLPALRLLAAASALPPARADQVVGLLGGAGVLLDGPGRTNARVDRAHLSVLADDLPQRWAADADAWALAYDTGSDGLALLVGRQRRRVLVDGAGRLGMTIASTLAAAGVGSVGVRDEHLVRPTDVGPAGHRPADVGANRAASGLRALDPWGLAPAGRAAPDLVVLVRDDTVDLRDADRLVAADRDHLAVVCAADRVSIGPLVTPGRGPCLRCLDLHRRDRDPAWPQVAAQLGAGRGTGRARGESASAVAAAGLATLQALLHLDGRLRPTTHAHTLEVQLPEGLPELRRWSVHPACGCAVLPQDPAGGR